MEWYHFIAALFAGVFLANTVPHFVHGISGDQFPTPFAKPPGKGLSSPFVNVLWALFNLLLGVLLVKGSKVLNGNTWSAVLMFLGIAAMSIRLSIVFSKKDKE